MSIQKLIINLLSVCFGIFIYNYITEQPAEATRNIYWALFGGCYIWFKMKKDIEQ